MKCLCIHILVCPGDQYQFQETSKKLEEDGLVWMREHLFSSSLVSSPGFGFLGPSRPNLVMHRMDGVDMWFLGISGQQDVDAGWYDISGELL